MITTSAAIFFQNGFDRSGLKGSGLQPLTGEELTRIHLASLNILERTGIVIHDEEAMQLLGEAGCRIEHEKNLVKVPQSLAEDAVDKAPSIVTLCGRNEEYDIRLGSGRVYTRIPGGATHIRDLETQEARKATIDDVAACARVSDALPNIHGLSMFQVTPMDVPIEVIDIHAAGASFCNTEKHLFYVCYNDSCIDDVIEMAAIVAGGKEALKKRPLISALCEATAPLRLVENQIKVLKSFASRGLPLMLHSHPVAGLTSPVTLGGELVMTNAEVLSLVIISQLITPNTPVVYGMSSSIPDMRSGLNLAGAVEIGLLGAAAAQLAHYYDIPCAMTSGIDSKTPDAQAAMERILTSLPPILAGIDLVNLSTTETKLTFCLEQLVIDDEIMSWIGRYLRGIKIDCDTLALNLIEEVGPGGTFIDKKHTAKCFKEELLTEGLVREAKGIRDAGETRDMQQRARDKVKEILREHTPKPLEKEIYNEINENMKGMR